MNVMDARPLKAAIQELADELADLPNFSKEYKKAVAAAKKKHAYMSGEGAATFIVNTAEKWADEMRQDRAERGSHSRVAPMESIQGRMARLLAEETPSVIGMPAEQLVKNLKAAEAAADKLVAAFDRLNHGNADEARAQVDAFKKAASGLKQYASDLLKY